MQTGGAPGNLPAHAASLGCVVGFLAVRVPESTNLLASAFDLLHHAGTDLLTWPFRERRAALESLFQGHGLRAPWALTPATADPDEARAWMRQWAPAGVEGIVAKGAGQSYEPGRRSWHKYRTRNTAEAVIGAVTGSPVRPGTVLLGRYTPEGELRLVARSAPLSPPLRAELAQKLIPAILGHPWQSVLFSAHWGSREPLQFTPAVPEMVAEFSGDTAIDNGRWRHPVRLVRVRTDLAFADVPRFGEGA